jgi:hypothetical protein
MTRKFQRRIEDFTCEHCGAAVSGDGYTNHCPRCLWSKHVDVHPGDRAANCGGLMEPISVTRKNGEIILTHRCQRCGQIKRNRAAPDDRFDLLLEFMARGDAF